jgi:hypothetical protein
MNDLSPATRERLDTLLRPDKADGNESAQDNNSGGASAVLLKSRGSPGRPSLASMQDELAKLEMIRQIDLPGDLFDRASPRDLERCHATCADILTLCASPGWRPLCICVPVA